MPSRAHRPSRAVAAALTTLLLAGAGIPLPVTGAEGRWGRQNDDPIAVAKRQRASVQGRIENQAERLARLRSSSRSLSVRMDRTVDKLRDLNSSLRDVEAEVAAARAELAATQAQHDALVTEVELLDWSLSQLTDQADELADDLGDRRRALGARLMEAWRTSQTPMWEQVLGAGSFVDVVVTGDGLVGFAQRDRELASDIERDQQTLDVRRRDIRSLRWETDQFRESVAASADQLAIDRDRLLAAEERLEERRAAVRALREEQEAAFRDLARTKEQVAELLAEQKRQAERLTARIGDLLEKERDAGRLPSAFNGRFRWPVIGRVTQDYGCTGFPLEPPLGDCANFHRGIDIAKGYGVPIVAAGDGVILSVGYEPDVPRSEAAWSVVIGHSNRLFTIYAHMVGRAPDGIREGVRVREGQLIGWMGNTGKSTGAHLQWGVWYGGGPVNPRYFL